MAHHAEDVFRQASPVASPVLPSLSYARTEGPLGQPIRYGYSSDHKLDRGPCQMHPQSIHNFPFDGDENRCRACVAGTCVQRVEVWPEGLIYVVHDCRSELS